MRRVIRVKRQILLVGRVLAAALLLAGAPLRAQDNFSFIDVFNQAIDVVQDGLSAITDELDSNIGLAMGGVPDYAGSDNYRVRVLPIIDIRHKDKWRLNGTKFTWNFRPDKKLKAGPLVNLKFGRKERRNTDLYGLGDIGTTVEVGAWLQYRGDYTVATLDYRTALGARQGSMGRLTVTQGLYKGEKFRVGTAARIKWLSGKAMQTNFGITEEQSAGSSFRYPVYNASSGFSEASLSLFGIYDLDSKWSVAGLVQASHMLGNAHRSPIVSQGIGDAFQVISGVGIIYSF